MTRNIQRILYWCVLHDGERQDVSLRNWFICFIDPRSQVRTTWTFTSHNFIKQTLQRFTNWYLNDRALVAFFSNVFSSCRETPDLSLGFSGLQTLGNPRPSSVLLAPAAETTWHFPRATVTPLELNWFAWMFLQPHPPLVFPIVQVASSEWLSSFELRGSWRILSEIKLGRCRREEAQFALRLGLGGSGPAGLFPRFCCNVGHGCCFTGDTGLKSSGVQLWRWFFQCIARFSGSV